MTLLCKKDKISIGDFLSIWKMIIPNNDNLVKLIKSNYYSEELIVGALKEAVYNGVNNFRYIDKIL